MERIELGNISWLLVQGNISKMFDLDPENNLGILRVAEDAS